jgi:hypothetical protein
VTVTLDTHDSITTEISRYPGAADVDQENYVLAEICAVCQPAQRDEQFPGQEQIHQACGYNVITATSLNKRMSGPSVMQSNKRWTYSISHQK